VTTPTLLLRRAVERDQARPRLTWFDEGSGERVELSGATLANWVNKTANLMIDELGLEPGDVVAIDLPRHWLTAVWWLAADAVGAVGVLGRDQDAALAVVGPDHLTDLPPSDEVVAVSLLPFGSPFRTPLPALVHDYAVAVRAQGDQFTPSAPGDEAVGQAAEQLAAEWGLGEHDRVLSFGPLTAVDDLVQGLLAPLAADASVVWVRNQPGADLVGPLAAERVTAAVGEPPTRAYEVPGIRWLPQPSVSC
jgi:uncharacterized protein (TIGR03089 family)